MDYLAAALPEPPLYPSAAFARAKLLELTQITDLYLELAARRVLPSYFPQTKPDDALAAEVRATLDKGAAALAKLARFDAFLLGDRFTAADLSGALHFPLVRMLSQQVLGCDPLGEIPGLEQYTARLEQRETVAKVRADAAADMPGFVAHLREHYGIAD